MCIAKRIAASQCVFILMAFSCSRGTHDSPPCLTSEQMDQIAQLDQASLSEVNPKPSKLTTGSYLLETKYPGKNVETYRVGLEIEGGRLVKAPSMLEGNLVTQDLHHDGSVVSWSQYDMDEGPAVRYVGLIDEEMLWGRAYVQPGVGWREGSPLPLALLK